MNKHLKPGVAVDVRGASDEDVHEVIWACIQHGADRDADNGYRRGEFVIWDKANDVWICDDSSDGYPIISISQAIGRESEVESKSAIVGQSNASNDWVERGELPPVGTECENNVPNIGWRKCTVACYVKGDVPVAILQYSNGWGHSCYSNEFRPLKTEKEKFVERFISDWTNCKSSIADFIADEYDEGLRFTE